MYLLVETDLHYMFYTLAWKHDQYL